MEPHRQPKSGQAMTRKPIGLLLAAVGFALLPQLGGGFAMAAPLPAPERIMGRVHLAQSASRATVREAQELLQKLGYDVGGADGVAGQRTRTAIRAFQADSGLPATGAISAALMSELRSVAAPIRVEPRRSRYGGAIDRAPLSAPPAIYPSPSSQALRPPIQQETPWPTPDANDNFNVITLPSQRAISPAVPGASPPPPPLSPQSQAAIAAAPLASASNQGAIAPPPPPLPPAQRLDLQSAPRPVAPPPIPTASNEPQLMAPAPPPLAAPGPPLLSPSPPPPPVSAPPPPPLDPITMSTAPPPSSPPPPPMAAPAPLVQQTLQRPVEQAPPPPTLALQQAEQPTAFAPQQTQPSPALPSTGLLASAPGFRDAGGPPALGLSGIEGQSWRFSDDNGAEMELIFEADGRVSGPAFAEAMRWSLEGGELWLVYETALGGRSARRGRLSGPNAMSGQGESNRRGPHGDFRRWSWRAVRVR